MRPYLLFTLMRASALLDEIDDEFDEMLDECEGRGIGHGDGSRGDGDGMGDGDGVASGKDCNDNGEDVFIADAGSAFVNELDPCYGDQF